MKIIGICGRSGSGKSTVCKFLSKFGAIILDCDQIYHNLVSASSPCLDEIKRRFGDQVVKDDSLDRKSLGAIVFNDSAALSDLNRISHHYVKEELKKQLEILKSEKVSVAVIDAPMLFEAKLETWCDLVCAVIANPEKQIERICHRDLITSEQAEARVKNQLSETELRKKASFVIENNGDLMELEKQCNRLLLKIQTEVQL